MAEILISSLDVYRNSGWAVATNEKWQPITRGKMPILWVSIQQATRPRYNTR